eukprot:GEMP01074329.1.p1 GENE.GEMP01074329.1~~GEMP01074329.1.p1  ORF type:complete len:154 (+),score=26.55 GEMP01074329.1:172-633(+)
MIGYSFLVSQKKKTMLRRSTRLLGACADCGSPCETGAIAAKLGENADTIIRHKHDGQFDPARIKDMHLKGVPFFTMFGGLKMNDKIRKTLCHSSAVALCANAEEIQVSCADCGLKKTIETPFDLLDPARNPTGRAAVAVCPSCIIEVKKSIFL